MLPAGIKLPVAVDRREMVGVVATVVPEQLVSCTLINDLLILKVVGLSD